MTKPYWQIIILTLVALLGFNAFALWQVIGAETLTKVINGQYQPYGLPANPFLDILKTVPVILILLCMFMWGLLLIWHKVTSQQKAMKKVTGLMASIIIASAAATASYFIDGTWSGVFHDGPMIGFPISPFVFTNARLIFILIMFASFYRLSRTARNNRQQA